MKSHSLKIQINSTVLSAEPGVSQKMSSQSKPTDEVTQTKARSVPPVVEYDGPVLPAHFCLSTAFAGSQSCS